MSELPVVEVLRRVVRLLDEHGIDWMIVGGFAVRILALPRTTFDVDLMVNVDSEDVATLANALDEGGLSIGDEFRRGYVDQLEGLGVIHCHAMAGGRLVRVDLFVLSSDYQRAAFARRHQRDSALGRLWVMSTEDLLLHKLLANRTRDQADVDDVLRVVGPLENRYLRRWASSLGIEDRLRSAFARWNRSLD